VDNFYKNVYEFCLQMQSAAL